MKTILFILYLVAVLFWGVYSGKNKNIFNKKFFIGLLAIMAIYLSIVAWMS